MNAPTPSKPDWSMVPQIFTESLLEPLGSVVGPWGFECQDLEPRLPHWPWAEHTCRSLGFPARFSRKQASLPLKLADADGVGTTATSMERGKAEVASPSRCPALP